ncbi:MAG: DegV family protein, partial [Dehalococcoidia bacterium]
MELAERYAIRIVPLSFIIGGQAYRDRIDITPKEVYEIMVSSNGFPTTLSPAPGEFLQAYQELGEWANGIVTVTICWDISMMFDSAVQAREMAKEELPHVTINVVDSRTAGGAQGFVALAAARAAESGKDLARVTEAAARMIPRVHMIAALDTLRYLAKAGRIPRIVAWGGSILRINPIFTFSHEGIGLLEKTRTKARAVQRLLKIMAEWAGGRPVHVSVMHANVPEEAGALRETIESRFERVELYITDFALTMGVQAGPGVLAVAFYREEATDVG